MNGGNGTRFVHLWLQSGSGSAGARGSVSALPICSSLFSHVSFDTKNTPTSDTYSLCKVLLWQIRYIGQVVG